MNIGVLGKGQLGVLLAQAAEALGHRVFFLSGLSREEEVFSTGWHHQEVVHAQGASAREAWLKQVQVVTCEHEHVAGSLLAQVQQQCPVRPSVQAVQIAGNRVREKEHLTHLGLPLVPWLLVRTVEEARQAGDRLGYPWILKTAEQGYDGKGQVWVHTAEQAHALVPNQVCVAEQVIACNAEVSQISVRDQQGHVVHYPPTHNHHEAGILRYSEAPAQLPPALQEQMKACMRLWMDSVGYLGTCAMEFFVQDQQLWINEVAPRVHNSGHWTLTGASSSQFTQHVWAITGETVQEPHMLHAASGMVNVLGHWPEALADHLGPEESVCDYHKSPRPQRKLGHVTVSSGQADTLHSRLLALKAICC